MQIEIDLAARDRIVDLYSRWGIDKADLAKAMLSLVAQHSSPVAEF